MAAKIMLSVLFGGFVLSLAYLYESVVLKSKRLRLKLEKARDQRAFSFINSLGQYPRHEQNQTQGDEVTCS